MKRLILGLFASIVAVWALAQVVGQGPSVAGGGTIFSSVTLTGPLVAKGTTFTLGTGTGACATSSTLSGGSIGGSFKCTGTAGASTQIINLPTSTGNAALWYCSASDATAGTAWANEIGSSTTGEVAGTITTTSDVVTFSCTAY
jgi:hypothetical protein